VVKNEKTGEIEKLICTYDPATRGGDSPDGRKVKATLHWVSAPEACEAELRLYDSLFTKRDPNEVEEGKEFVSNLNPKSLEVLAKCKLEPSLAKAKVGGKYQFERQGYFCIDSVDSTKEKPVFNRIVSLKDTWAKVVKRETNI